MRITPEYGPRGAAGVWLWKLAQFRTATLRRLLGQLRPSGSSAFDQSTWGGDRLQSWSIPASGSVVL